MKVSPTQSGMHVIVMHKTTGLSLERACDSSDVSGTSERLRLEIIKQVLGQPEGIEIALARAIGGEKVWAVHTPTGMRTAQHWRRDMKNETAAMIEELMVLVWQAGPLPT